MLRRAGTCCVLSGALVSLVTAGPMLLGSRMVLSVVLAPWIRSLLKQAGGKPPLSSILLLFLLSPSWRLRCLRCSTGGPDIPIYSLDSPPRHRCHHVPPRSVRNEINSLRLGFGHHLSRTSRGKCFEGKQLAEAKDSIGAMQRLAMHGSILVQTSRDWANVNRRE